MPRQPKPARRRPVIYGLVDPRDGLIYYVGKTTNPATRVDRHLKERSNKARVDWINSLVGIGKRPVLVVLEVVPAGTSWEEREIWWIAHGRATGWPLVNISDGGDPGPRYRNRVGRSHRSSRSRSLPG